MPQSHELAQICSFNTVPCNNEGFMRKQKAAWYSKVQTPPRVMYQYGNHISGGQHGKTNRDQNLYKLKIQLFYND